MTHSLEALAAEFRDKLDDRIRQIGEFDDSKVLRHESMGQWVAILRDCNNNLKWRIQRFDEKGFIGHEVYDTKSIAIENAARERFSVCDDGAMDRLAATTAFHLGNAISSERDKLNGSMISFKEYLSQVSKLTEEYSLQPAFLTYDHMSSEQQNAFNQRQGISQSDRAKFN